MKVRLVTLARTGPSSSYRIYTEKIGIALRAAGASPVEIDAIPTSAESRFGGVLRPTWSHFLGSFPRDGEFRDACEPNTAYRGVDVVTIHDLYPYLRPGLMYRAFRAVTRSSARRATRIVTQVETIKADIGKYLGREAFDKTRVVPPPFPIPPPGRSEPRYDVLWIGNVDARKHADRFLRGVADRAGPRLRIAFVCHGASPESPGELREPFERARVRHDMEWISTHVGAEELEQLYRSSRSLISTSSLEGYHNPPMEAWARGTPTVLPRIPLYEEIYGTVGGVHYFEPGGSFDEALNVALETVSHDPDPGLLKAVSFPEVGRRLLEVYSEIPR